MSKTVIRNATVYDGSGGFPFVSDVLVDGDRIEKVARNIDGAGAREVDAAGLALCPGFIDTHSHSDLEMFRHPDMAHAIRQGTTTELVGQDGSSVAPVTDEMVDELMDNMAPLAGGIDRPYWWRSFGQYLEEARKARPATRIEALVGHGTVRMMAMGNDIRKPTADELERMKRMIAECMEQGARGMSLGLIYPPGSFGDEDEIAQLCAVVAQYDGICMVHMRDEKSKLLESIAEMERITRKSGVRMHISHLKALGYRNWGHAEQALRRLEALREEGLEFTFDQYPYTAACTGLKVIVPMWAFEGGEQGFQARLKNDEYPKVLAETEASIEERGGPDRIRIASVVTAENAWMAGKTLAEIAGRMNLPPAQAALKMLEVEGPGVIAIYFSISEDDVAAIMKSPLQGVCSDGIMGAHPHPRLYGTFPRLIGHYARDLKLMSVGEAVRKITSAPAARLRLWDRGLVREGMLADLVLFDPGVIIDKSTYDQPKLYPEGILKVWVGGELRFDAAADN